MKQEIKERWVAELRSGRYKQGRQALRDHNNNFCCLGVLADIYDDRWKKEDDNMYSWDIDTQLIPTWLQEEIGLSSNDCVYLANLNDGLGELRRHTFEEIADYIEENL